MTSKDRFLSTCRFESTDRPPVDYLAHPEADRKLKEYLKCKTEDELLEALGCDFYYLSCRDISQNEGHLKCYVGAELDITDDQRVCPLGIRWRRGAYDSKFAVDEAIRGPLEDAQSEAAILGHRWPKAADFDFSVLLEECEPHSDKVIVGGPWSGIMGDSYRLHGYENFLVNIALRPELIKTLVSRVTDTYLELNDKMFTQLKGKLDVWFFGNDFGSQNGLLVSEPMWLDFFFEPIKQLVELAHSHGLKAMMHSCGGISLIIPHLIRAGVDILDPIQTTALGMEPDGLREQFGRKIVFHGGVDTQNVLPFGTPNQVAEHASDMLKRLGGDGGYIFAPSQILGPDIPAENIARMYGVISN